LRLLNTFLHKYLISESDNLRNTLGIRIDVSDEAEVSPAAVADGGQSKEEHASEEQDGGADAISSFLEDTAPSLVQNILASIGIPIEEGRAPDPPVNSTTTDADGVLSGKKLEVSKHDFKDLEALVAESTSDYVRNTLNGLSRVSIQMNVPTPTGE
jgi:hypothetical protein